tara:strand:+ start:1055 stop:4087 length:3033 start_codon:yes stop_codon:yes gene_type:complete
MLNKQKNVFFNGGSVGGLTEDALLVFLVEVLRSQGKKKFLFISESDNLNKRICRSSRWFEKELVYYPEKDTNKTVPGFLSQYNRYRSDAIIKVATWDTVCCISTAAASKKTNINKRTVPVVFEVGVGDVLDRDDFKQRLLDLGYRVVNSVFSPGDTSIRGSVVDVFPVYEKAPVRISFGFNDVESISFFNIDSQRTIRAIQKYGFWDVFGKEVELGLSLVDFIAWDAIATIVKKDTLFSVVQTRSSEYSDSGVVLLQRKIRSKKDFLSFLTSEPHSLVYLICTDKNKVPGYTNTNVCSLVGKINNSFFVKGSQSFFIPFWKNKNKNQNETPLHKPLLNINLKKIKPGDFIVHVLHGVGTYGGLKTRGAEGFQKEYIRVLYANGGVLYVPLNKLELIHPYVGLGGKPRINSLGKKEWGRNVSKTKKEIELVSNSLIEIHRSKNKQRGFIYKKAKDLEVAIKKSFPHKETKDQKKTIREVLSDLKNKKPMDRLVCGDVGFGKTEVALRAIVRVVSSGKQVLFLCPTTVLSDQHYISTVERLEPLGVRVALLSRFQTKVEQKKITTNLMKLKIDVAIGTHRLLSDDVVCPQLGLLIIDEEHRFGVKHKESIRVLRPGIDLLSLSATPIPRTLQQSILGIRDISRIETPPITRKPIKTYVEFFSWARSSEIIKEEVLRGGQVYFLHNDIQSIDYYTQKIQKLVPETVVRNIHGQQKSKNLEKTLLGFFNGSISVLVCSTIIESGLDVSNANCMIINNPQNLGLSQLYQIRGRVGRGPRQASCYLFVPPKTVLSEAAFRRLKTIERHTSLGSGYSIASSDLDIRGSGLVFGYKQSGIVSRVGVEYYNTLLKSAINKKLEKPTESEKTTLVFWGKALIPIYYISNSSDRFSFYTKIHNAIKEEDFKDIKNELRDRYGKIPKETTSFIRLAELSILFRGSFVKNINVGQRSLVFKVPNRVVSGEEKLISEILSYESNNVVEKKFKKEIDYVSVIFLTNAGYDWFGELIKCNSLFYKT